MVTTILIFVVVAFALAVGTTIISNVILSKPLKTAANETKQIHKIVNQQRTDMINYQKTLVEALQSQGIDVPDNPHPSE